MIIELIIWFYQPELSRSIPYFHIYMTICFIDICDTTLCQVKSQSKGFYVPFNCQRYVETGFKH